MKRCENQNCRTDFLFSDNKTICPFCGRALVENNEHYTMTRPLFGNDIIAVPELQNDIGFLQRKGHKIECHGEIVEIDHHEVFNSRFHKTINALFRGEPYQFAHQTMEYVIRVRRITNGYTGDIADFHLFGNYMGKFQIGDEVNLTANVCGNRNVATSIHNESTNQKVSGGIVVPANLIRLFYTVLLFMLVSFAITLVACIASGKCTGAIINILIIACGVGAGWLWIKKKIFRRGRR